MILNNLNLMIISNGRISLGGWDSQAITSGKKDAVKSQVRHLWNQ